MKVFPVSKSAKTTTTMMLLPLSLFSMFFSSSHALSSPLSSSIRPEAGSASKPLDKQNIAVWGAGGYMGSLAFGFLQRAGNLYGTGLGKCRAVAATADTAVRLNRVLSKNFCLAVADESVIKLTELQSVDFVASRLEGWDAIVLGSNLAVCRLPVTGGSYEKTPNDKTWECYWDPPVNLKKGDPAEEAAAENGIVETVLLASKQAGIKHIVLVDDDERSDSNVNFLAKLEESGVPYTYIRPTGEMVSIPNYTFRKGVQGKLQISAMSPQDALSSATGSSPSEGQISKEDLAALSIQVLQSLDWSQSRCFKVAGLGPVEDDGFKNPKRADQEWCVDSYRLQAALAEAGL